MAVRTKGGLVCLHGCLHWVRCFIDVNPLFVNILLGREHKNQLTNSHETTVYTFLNDEHHSHASTQCVAQISLKLQHERRNIAIENHIVYNGRYAYYSILRVMNSHENE